MIVRPTLQSLLKRNPSKYSLVIGTAKRARQISQGEEVLVKTDDVAPVTIAADEIEDGKVTVENDNEK